MGVSPESQDSRPREEFLREQGGFREDRLILDTQRQRLDWNVLPTPPPPSTGRGNDVPRLIAVEQGVTLLEAALNTTLQQVSLVTRLALGVVLIKPTHNLSEGIDTILKYVPHLEPALRGASDLIYQINRRRRSTIAQHVWINRLSKWTLEEYHSGSLLISPVQTPVFRTSDPLVLTKASLDINTVPGNSAVSIKKMPGLLEEFINFAREIATKGDIA